MIPNLQTFRILPFLTRRTLSLTKTTEAFQLPLEHMRLRQLVHFLFASVLIVINKLILMQMAGPKVSGAQLGPDQP